MTTPNSTYASKNEKKDDGLFIFALLTLLIPGIVFTLIFNAGLRAIGFDPEN